MKNLFLNALGSYVVRSRLLVFNFHNVMLNNCNGHYIGLSEDEFVYQLEWICNHFTVLPLSQALDWSASSSTFERPVAAITFDDGYKSHFSIAHKHLSRLGVHAAFFITSGHLKGAHLWNDWVRFFCSQATEGEMKMLEELLRQQHSLESIDDNGAQVDLVELSVKYMTLKGRQPIIDHVIAWADGRLPEPQMIDRDEVRQLRQCGHEIGSHTKSHPILAMEPPENALIEIRDDVVALSELIGEDIKTFAFPNGQPGKDFNQSHLVMLRECAIEVALTSRFGHVRNHTDLLQLPRISLKGGNSKRFIRSVMSAYLSN